MSTFVAARTARKYHRCSCGRAIRPGERYLKHTATPWDEVNECEHWAQLNECSGCAERYGRGQQLASLLSDTCPAVDTDPAGSACRPAMPYAEPKEQP